MQITFPCGAKGRPEFCPNVCQYGKFCKIAKKKEEPRGLADVREIEDEGKVEEIKEKPEVQFYY